MQTPLFQIRKLYNIERNKTAHETVQLYLIVDMPLRKYTNIITYLYIFALLFFIIYVVQCVCIYIYIYKLLYMITFLYFLTNVSVLLTRLP